MRKQKVLTPEEKEEIRTKDFFDMILPSTLRFMSYHYTVGDSYRCVWVVREYPPSTEEQSPPCDEPCGFLCRFVQKVEKTLDDGQ